MIVLIWRKAILIPVTWRMSLKVKAIDEDLDPIKVLIAPWKSLSPPVAKESVLGKWHAVVYSTKRTGQLFASKIMKRFLGDENGAVDCLNTLPQTKSGAKYSS